MQKINFKNHKLSKPNLVISKCLGFENCRWNGDIINSSFIEKLKSLVNFYTICPECEIGLGVPRDPVRIVFKDNEYRLMQLNTKKDLTEKMNEFAKNFVISLTDIDGFILKDRSPSCGIKEVKIYPNLEKTAPIKKGTGFFANVVLQNFTELPIETETRLTNLMIREHFLTRIFAYASFREISKEKKMADLVDFHSRYKLLLMSYNEKQLRIMGKIVANNNKKGVIQLYSEYKESLYKAFERKQRHTSAINALMHGFGYFSKYLNSEEKKFFLDTLEQYRNKQVSLSVPLKILYTYALRFDQSYIKNQALLNSFPILLLSLEDSDK